MIAAFGRYEVMQPLATGGMAELFLARARGTAGFEKVLVVKRILPELAQEPDVRAMFLDEARLAAMLEHPNVVQVFDLGEDGGELYFAMEYVHGSDVRQLQRARPQSMPIETAIEIAVQAAAGLHYAHDRIDRNGAPLAIVHRDVSPANLLCTWQGNIKVADFGIAKTMTQSAQARTRTGALRGKVMYMSPEQARGEALDRRSDVFSLGIVLWELLAGRRLYDAEHEYALLHKLTTTDAPAPSAVRDDCPPELDRIVRTALARDRAHRYPSAAAMRDDLVQLVRLRQLASGPEVLAREMLARLGVPTPLPAVPVPRVPTAVTVLEGGATAVSAPSLRRGRRRLGWFGGAVAVGGLAVFGVTRLGGSTDPAPAPVPSAIVTSKPEPTPAPGPATEAAAEPVTKVAPAAKAVPVVASPAEPHDATTASKASRTRSPARTTPKTPAKTASDKRAQPVPAAPQPAGLDLDSALP